MKILVTGGAGFIGSHLVDLFVANGEDVVIVDNLATGKKENLNIKNFSENFCGSKIHEKGFLNVNAKFYKADICDFEKLKEIFNLEKPRIVIHCAANPMLRLSIEDPLYDARVNILGTISVLECCRIFNVRKIIYTSTGGARVGEPEYLPVDEKHPLNPCSPYGISKHSAEHYVWMYNQIYGLDYLIFCFGNVYGPRDDAVTGRLIPVFIEKMLKGESPKIFGDGLQTRDFIYVKDLAEFIVESINKKPFHKLFHLANGKQISVNEVWMLLKNISGFAGNAEHIEAVKGEVRDIVLDIGLARTELEWEPKTSFEKGLKETWEWFQYLR